MKIILTGHRGFLGTHVVECLNKSGHEWIGLSRSDGGDLRKRAKLLSLVDKFYPDAIIHLAAVVGGIGANDRQPATFWHDNLLMGLNVLNVCSEYRINKLVMIGSTCSYPRTPKSIPFREEELFDGYPEETNAPYGIAKRTLIVGAQAYRKESGLNAITLIPTNLFGEGDNFDLQSSHVIPAMMRKMHEAKESGVKEVVLWGTGKPTRDFLYAQDAAQAIEIALRVYNDSTPLNVGSGIERSIKSIAHLIAEIVEFDGDIIWDETKPDGQPRRVLDSSLAQSKLKWEPKADFASALKKTYDWWLARNDTKKLVKS